MASPFDNPFGSLALAPATRSEDQPGQLRDVLQRVKDAKALSEKIHRPYRDRWDKIYGRYRAHLALRDAVNDAGTERDRDQVMRDAQKDWPGASLMIPYAFATVETILPRALLQEPKMTVKPRSADVAPSNAKAIQELFEARQLEIDYALRLHPAARRGFIYGLGVSKTFWEQKTRTVPRLERGIFGIGQVLKPREIILSEGPQIEDVELADFFWDPAAKDIETCRYVIHRTWRDMRYITAKVEQGYENGGWFPLDLQAVATMGSDTARGDVFAERMRLAGFDEYDSNQGRLHEVWEYHDGEMIYTVLDGQLVVRAAPSPFFHRSIPFQIFRPTMVPGEFVGIGEIEPMEQLSDELDTLRSQRRDNATLILQKAFMYAEGLVDPADLVIGPGKGIPTLGNPAEVLAPIEIGEIPASGYAEEKALKDDIERVTGISDPVSGGSGSGTQGSDTATGIQLIQAAANVRVQLKAKMLRWETVQPQARQWLELWAQFLTKPRDVRIDDSTAELGYRFVEITPEMVRLPLDVIPVDGSMEPDNPPQRKNDALSLWNILQGSTRINQDKALLHVLSEFDVPDPESWIAPELSADELLARAVGANPAIGQALVVALTQGGEPQEQAQQEVLAVVQQAMANAAATSGGGPPQNGNGNQPAPQGQGA